MRRVLITGTSNGVGCVTALKFLKEDYKVFGIDLLPCPSELSKYFDYTHYVANVADVDSLPRIDKVNILINNAGVQGSGIDIDINLKGLMNVTEKYALGNKYINAVLNQAAASAHLGTDYPEYVASKGGVIAYTKWVAKEIAQYGATCNSLSFGGILSESNATVTNNPELWTQVMELTPLKRWTTMEEVAEWIFFMTTVNKSCSGSDIVIDNLESLNGVFVWE